MASELGVQTIQHTNGTDAMTIDSSGRISFSQKPYVDVDLGGTTGSYQSMSAGAIPFNTVRDGDSSLWSTTNYQFTCPVDGLYLVCHSTLAQSDSNHEVYVYKVRSGVSAIQARFFRQKRTNNGSIVLSCLANDLIYWNNANGTNFYNGTGANRYTFGTIALIR